MSESAGGTASVGASPSTPSTSGAPASATSTPSAAKSNPNPNASHAGPGGGQPPIPQAAGVNPNEGAQGADELEEISLGSTKAKVKKDVAQAIKNYERGIQQKFEQAARERKEFQQAIELNNLFKTDPDAWAERMGIDIDSFAEERLAKKYELMQASPEQRQLMEANKKLADYEAQVLSHKKPLIDAIKELVPQATEEELKKYNPQQLEKILEHQRHQYTQTQQSLDKEFGEAWKDSGLPKHKYFGSMMAYQMIAHEKKTGQPLQASEAAAKVKAEFHRNIQEVFGQLDPQGIQQILGKEILEKLRQADIDRVTSQGASQFGKNGPGNPPASPEPKKYVNEIEYRRLMGIG